jgi:small subunit ribosomal protein S5
VAERIDAAGLNLEERVIDIWRCATVVKGGKRFSFAVMSVVGNGAGVLGVGYGKAREVPNAIEKAVKDAKKRLLRVTTFGSTIPHEVRGTYGASEVVMIPALPGTGVIAGAAVRAVLECIGVRDVLTKSVGGSNNSKNLVKAAVRGLQKLRGRDLASSLRGIQLAADTQLEASLKAPPPRQRFEREERPPRGGEGGRRRGRGPARAEGEAAASAPAAAAATATAAAAATATAAAAAAATATATAAAAGTAAGPEAGTAEQK